MRTSKVERIFVGKVEQRPPGPKNDYQGKCALCQKVDEIDPSSLHRDAQCQEFSANLIRTPVN